MRNSKSRKDKTQITQVTRARHALRGFVTSDAGSQGGGRTFSQAEIVQLREEMHRIAEMTVDAGMEFWPFFGVLAVPDAERVRKLRPELFNRDGEPDMGKDAIYQLLTDQLDELREIAPRMTGIEMWMAEDAPVIVALLKHQKLSADEI